MCGLGGGPRHARSGAGVHPAIWVESSVDGPVLALPDDSLVGRLGSESSRRGPRPAFHLLRLPRDPGTGPSFSLYHDRHRDPPGGRRRERGGSLGGPPGEGFLPERLGDSYLPGSRGPRDRNRPRNWAPDQGRLRQYPAVSPCHPHVGARRPIGLGSPRGWRRAPSPRPPRIRTGFAQSGYRDPDDEDLDAGSPSPRFRQDRSHEGTLRLRRPLQARASELAHLDGDDPRDHGRGAPLRYRRD